MQFEANWQWTFDDFKVLNKAYFQLTPWRRRCKYILPLLMVLFFAVAAYFFWVGDNVGGWAFVAYAILLLVLKLVLAPRGFRRRYNQQQLEGHNIVLQADDAGVHLETHQGDTNYKWSGFPYITILDGHTILWQNLILGIAIPDRAFSSPEEARQFAAFAEEKTVGQTF